MSDIIELSVETFFKLLKDTESKFSRENKLEIGAGKLRDDFVTIDKHGKATWNFDIRQMFAPVYIQHKPAFKQGGILGKYHKFDGKTYDYIKLQHLIEHIEWIYQDLMFKWFNSLLNNYGYIFIETPNIDYIIDLYLTGKADISEHPDLKTDDPCVLVKWLNFKLYSGCSTTKFIDGCVDGDFHLCMYNKELLISTLEKAGFVVKAISIGETLLCLAQKV